MTPDKWDITIILLEKSFYNTILELYISYLIIIWMWRGKISLIFRKILKLHQILATLSLKEICEFYILI